MPPDGGSFHEEGMVMVSMTPDAEITLDEEDVQLDDELMAAIAAAEAAVESLAEDYPAQLSQDAGTLADAMTRLRSAAPYTEEHAAASVDAFGVLHDIKGQAGSFGFDIATRLAGPYCEALRGMRQVAPGMIDLLDEATSTLCDIAAAAEREEFGPRVDDLLRRLAECSAPAGK
ncbi:hypothetical protein GTQ45_02980 [Pyruvatibacter mobilis]|uniref:HPt domain-containing protein n=1 Tax=Pyruvatibacter mobilis TaxID=1712261 RepID=A0A845Q9B9_9HYPH|nr:hypothetical protein [Pyruvatibacter mobilis]NBG94691.1 hypothetical protein [Pyruvatibacter mobilis]QJD74196.1 hypothetical protein HG718_01530 [Pyruvatibacter mobilis]